MLTSLEAEEEVTGMLRVYTECIDGSLRIGLCVSSQPSIYNVYRLVFAPYHTDMGEN